MAGNPVLMPPDRRQSDRYSLDDMLERVRSERSTPDRPPEEVMPDGTVRVRRRKRRSHQPVYGQRKRRRLLLGGVLAALLGAAALGFYALQRAKAHYKSPAFAPAVVEALRTETGVDLELQGLAIEGTAITCDRLRIPGPDGGPFESLVLEDLSAEIGHRSRLTRKWNLDGLKAAKGWLVLRPAEMAALQGIGEVTTSFQFEGGEGLRELAIGRVEVDDLEVSWGVEGEGLRKLDAIAASQGRTRWSLHLDDGEILLRGLPVLAIDYANFNLDSDAVRVENARFGPVGATQTMSATGALAYVPGSTSRLEITIEKLPTERLLPRPWSDYVTGLLGGEFRFLPARAKTPRLIEGDAMVTEARIEDLPFWQAIPPEIRDPLTTHGTPEIATASLRWNRDGLHLGNVRMGKAEIGMLVGDLSWTPLAGAIRGEFQFGLPNRLLAELPGGPPAMFRNGVNGDLSWSPVVVGGTPDAPTEDFTSRFQQAIGSPAPPDE